MKKTFLQVLFERLTGATTPEATEAIPTKAPPRQNATSSAERFDSVPVENEPLFNDMLEALRQRQRDLGQSRAPSVTVETQPRASVTAEQTIPAEFVFEEPEQRHHRSHLESGRFCRIKSLLTKTFRDASRIG
jgi:hypothetical protein